jgi:hypothetical protein
MLLQSTAALTTSPLHGGSDDGSSFEETSSSPAFRLLRLSLRSRLEIWRILCYTLRTARLLSTAACFWLKIAFSERGALARTRWVHFNCDDKKARRLVGEDEFR